MIGVFVSKKGGSFSIFKTADYLPSSTVCGYTCTQLSKRRSGNRTFDSHFEDLKMFQVQDSQLSK
jgi:hypothetical protein